MPIADMEARIALYYHEVAAGRDIRIEGSIALLRRLARERPVCIVSGSSTKTVAAAVDHLGIGDALRFFLGADDYSPGKPHPAGYLLAAERLRVPPADCLVFEDSEAGLRAAKAAGMRCVVLLRDVRNSQDFSTADLVLADLADFDPATLPR
jgi:sugar-phosphatase